MKLTISQIIFCNLVMTLVLIMLGYLIRDFVGEQRERDCFKYCDKVSKDVTDIYNLLNNAEIYAEEISY